MGFLINNPGDLLLFSIAPVIIVTFIPVLNIPGLGFAYLIGKCFFFNKQKKYHEEMTEALEKFTQLTQLPKSQCNTTLISKFIGYLENYQADNLKECHALFYKEEQDKKVLAELQSLNEQISAVSDEVYNLKNYK